MTLSVLASRPGDRPGVLALQVTRARPVALSLLTHVYSQEIPKSWGGALDGFRALSGSRHRGAEGSSRRWKSHLFLP